MNSLKVFFTSLLSNSPGISFGRFMSLLLSVFVLGWDTGALVFAWHFNYHLPTGMGMVDLLPSSGTLLAQGGFCTLFYGVTKYGDVQQTAAANPAPVVVTQPQLTAVVK